MSLLLVCTESLSRAHCLRPRSLAAAAIFSSACWPALSFCCKRTRSSELPFLLADVMSRDHSSLPVDPNPDEWILKPVDPSATASGVDNSRLAALERRQPKLPPLPPQHTEWSSASRQQAEDTEEQKQPQQTASGSSAFFRGGGSDSESESDDDSMRDTDDQSTAAASTTSAEEARSTASGSNAAPRAAAAAAAAPRRRVMLGADPLYDDAADDADEAWLHSHPSYSSHAPPRRQQAAAVPQSRSRGGPRTDAHLSCPACFTPLCIDCQRHATRPHCFRAMFVLADTMVDKGWLVRPEAGTESDDPNERFFAVLCRVCKSHVGVIDQDEVYHFFNVIESQG